LTALLVFLSAVQVLASDTPQVDDAPLTAGFARAPRR
jgi:hypothetical protein